MIYKFIEKQKDKFHKSIKNELEFYQTIYSAMVGHLMMFVGCSAVAIFLGIISAETKGNWLYLEIFAPLSLWFGVVSVFFQQWTTEYNYNDILRNEVASRNSNRKIS